MTGIKPVILKDKAGNIFLLKDTHGSTYDLIRMDGMEVRTQKSGLTALSDKSVEYKGALAVFVRKGLMKKEEHILNQLVAAGLLNERVYHQSEDSEGDHVTASQAKIDPSAPQTVSNDPPPATEPGNEADTGDDEDKPAVDEDEEEPKPDTSITVDGARGLAALHAALHSCQVLADLVYGAKDELVAKMGEESAPALHEILFKVKTAHETLDKLMTDVNAKDDEAKESEGEEAGEEADLTGDTEEPSNEVTPPTEDKPGETAT